MQTIDEAIRERAYHLWLADGQRDGQADAYWLAAQRYVLSASLADPAIDHAAMPRETVGPAMNDQQATYPAKKAKTASAPKKSKRRAA